MGNTALNNAKNAKQDEFYTQLKDVEQELAHYRQHFEGKIIYLNCDDPEFSAFWQYFSYNFDFFALKKLTSTHYEEDGSSSYMLTLEEQYDTNNPNIIKKPLKGNGDFRSEECIELLKEADIVLTNPPFSLFREYVAQLMEYEKDFVILGNQNAYTYKEIFPLLKEGKMWVGNKHGNMEFRVPNREEYKRKGKRFWIDENGDYWRSLGNICWFTNLDIPKRHEKSVLTKFYEDNEDQYPSYDNYDAIEVDKVSNIPMDYKGIMGVPITFINNFNPEQFEIYSCHEPALLLEDAINIGKKSYKSRQFTNENGEICQKTYHRVFVRNKEPITKKELLGY